VHLSCKQAENRIRNWTIHQIRSEKVRAEQMELQVVPTVLKLQYAESSKKIKEAVNNIMNKLPELFV
jgi:hypothetical protein